MPRKLDGDSTSSRSSSGSASCSNAMPYHGRWPRGRRGPWPASCDARPLRAEVEVLTRAWHPEYEARPSAGARLIIAGGPDAAAVRRLRVGNQVTTPSVPPRPVRQVRKDLRAYIDALDELGELQRIDAEVSLDYELGAIVRRSYDLMAPAPLFTNMSGVEPGFRVLGAPAGRQRAAGALPQPGRLSSDCRRESTGAEIVAALVAAREAAPIPLASWFDRPVQGGDRARRRGRPRPLPAPLLHGTGRGAVPQHLRDHRRPHPGRQLDELVDLADAVPDARRMTGLVVPDPAPRASSTRCGASAGEDMPVAVVMGMEPVIPFVGGMPIPRASTRPTSSAVPRRAARRRALRDRRPRGAGDRRDRDRGDAVRQRGGSRGADGRVPRLHLSGRQRAEADLQRHALTHRMDPILPVGSPGTRWRRTTPRGASRTAPRSSTSCVVRAFR